jgi:ribosomal protein S7
MLKKKSLKTRFLNKIFVSGKKQKSEVQLLKCFKSLQHSQKTKCSIEILKLALKNSSPFFQLKTIKNKTRKSSIEIPFLLNEELRLFYGIKNLLTTSNSLIKVEFYKRLMIEILKSSDLKGQSVKNKKRLHENAFLQRKFARYRWF